MFVPIGRSCNRSEAILELIEPPSKRERHREKTRERLSGRSFADPPLLDLRSAAINKQFDAGDETGILRSQKQRNLGDFF